MDFLFNLLIEPWITILTGPLFFGEVVIGGILSGVMYSLVALGFVLIYKASGVFNFAQGVMVLFAALSLVGLMERGVPLLLAIVLTGLIMLALAFAIERVILQIHGQPGADHPVHGHHRPHLLPRRVRRDAVGLQRQGARHRHSRRCRSTSRR